MAAKEILKLSPFLFLSTLVLSIPLTSRCQQITGNLQGRVLDSLDHGIPAATVEIVGPNVQGSRSAVTDETGSFTMLQIPSGRIALSVRHPGYQPLTIQGISIELGRTTYLGDIHLQARVLEFPEVIITDTRPAVDPAATTYGANLRASEFERLPIDRDYRSIATLTPLANTSYLNDEVNFAGATGRENKYFVDGVDVTDPSFARDGTTLPYNFIKEIQIISGGYEAEYRSSLGGQTNVITYSGSNELHGSAFGFFTNNGLSASRKGGLLDPTQGSFSNYDVGFGIGGPIIVDALWFFAAYNPSVKRRDVELPGLGTYVDKTMIHSFAAKLTWKTTDRLTLIFSSTGDPTVRKAVGETPPGAGNPARLANPDPYLADITGGGVNLSFDASYMAGDRLLLNASVSRTVRDETKVPSTDRGRTDMVLIDEETKVWSGGGFGHLSFLRSGSTVRASGTVLAGPHTLKGGVEYRGVNQTADLDYALYLRRYSDTSFTFIENGTHGTVKDQTISLYLQDSWQLTSRLRIHAGLRWDEQWIYGGNGSVVHVVDGPLQPRAGFAVLLDDDGTQRVFGSYGRFAQEWSSAVMTTYTGTQYFAIQDYNVDPRIAGFIPVAPDKIPERTLLRGQHYDELSLGYEQVVCPTLKATVQGIYRTLREAINTGIVEGVWYMGNPGSGLLSGYPKAQRNYHALVVTIGSWANTPLNFLFSYVLSRNFGNYEGLYDSFNKNVVPNVNFSASNTVGSPNLTGLLPNDRTHVFKASGSYRFDIGLIVGGALVWQSGTPLSDVASLGWYLQPRGSAGRTPAIWDFSLRAIYPLLLSDGWQTNLILDAYHIGSSQKPVDFDQEHYYSVDGNGNPLNPNPTYGEATRFQPPMSVRLGVEATF